MELQKVIQQFLKEKQYESALSYFKEHKNDYSKQEIASNIYLTANIIQCLRLTKSWKAAESYLQIYKIEINDSTPERIVTSKALLLYDWYKSPDKKPEDEKIIVEKIIRILPILGNQKSEFSQNLYNTLVFRILKTEAKKNQPDWNLINRFCETVNPLLLNKKPYSITIERNGKNRESELASLYEDWYTQYSKALFNTGKFERCIAISEEALNEIDKMHYSNEIWFARRIAQCYKVMGEMEMAIAGFEKLLQKKNDWFLLAETAYLYLQRKENDKALNLMLNAMAGHGDINYKVELIEQLGNLYHELNHIELALDHWKLAYCIRKTEGWAIGSQLAGKAGTEHGSFDLETQKQTLIRKLQNGWKPASSVSGSANRLTGTIIRISKPKENGNDVIIKGENNKDYYAFIKTVDEIYPNLKTGLKVSFFTRQLSGKPLDKAVRIKEIKSH